MWAFGFFNVSLRSWQTLSRKLQDNQTLVCHRRGNDSVESIEWKNSLLLRGTGDFFLFPFWWTEARKMEYFLKAVVQITEADCTDWSRHRAWRMVGMETRLCLTGWVALFSSHFSHFFNFFIYSYYRFLLIARCILVSLVLHFGFWFTTCIYLIFRLTAAIVPRHIDVRSNSCHSFSFLYSETWHCIFIHLL